MIRACSARRRGVAPGHAGHFGHPRPSCLLGARCDLEPGHDRTRPSI